MIGNIHAPEAWLVMMEERGVYGEHCRAAAMTALVTSGDIFTE